VLENKKKRRGKLMVINGIEEEERISPQISVIPARVKDGKVVEQLVVAQVPVEKADLVCEVISKVLDKGY